jgi:hypothetical protein
MDSVTFKSVLAALVCFALLAAGASGAFTGETVGAHEVASLATGGALDAVPARGFVQGPVTGRGEHIAWNLAFWVLGLGALTAHRWVPSARLYSTRDLRNCAPPATTRSLRPAALGNGVTRG